MRSAVICLALAASAGMGCVSMPSWWEKSKAEAPGPVAEKAARPRPPVTAEDITENNAREMASALLDELDRAGRTESLSAAEKAQRLAGGVLPNP
jgi:hypothetical protein